VSPAELERSQLEELSSHWLAGWQGGAGFAACCTPDVAYEDPLAAEATDGLDALECHAERLRRALPDLRIERSAEPLAGGPGGDFACLPWRLAGTHRRGVGELPPTGRFVVVHGLHYVELVDGEIRRARGFFDLHDVGVQLGLVPGRGSLAESTLLLLRGFGLRRRGGE
jgi:predicted ester cyclase